jgi:hypothetical protein
MKDIRGSTTLPADLRGHIVLDGDAPGGTCKVTSVAQSKDGFNHVAVDYVPAKKGVML